jgi:hypothetical protein
MKKANNREMADDLRPEYDLSKLRGWVRGKYMKQFKQGRNVVLLSAHGGKLSNYARDKFIAPFMSAFSSADIRDMSSYCDQSTHWVSNFVLNTMYRINIASPSRQYLFNYLRRAEAAFRQHDLARKATSEFLAGSRQSPSQYMMAIFHWEVFLSQAWHAYNVLRYFCSMDKLFEPGQGSVKERLHRLYTQSKHTESLIKDGNFPKEATIAVWPTNDGLSSNDTQLSYQETADILKELSKWAMVLQDPGTIPEKLKAMQP